MAELLPMSDIAAAYLAGIIDGEGYIGLNRKKVGRYELCFAVKSTCHELPKWIHDTTGLGTIRQHNDKRPLVGGGVRHPIKEWRAFGADAAKVLERIERHLMVKRRQAQVGIEYQALSAEDRRVMGADYHAQLMYHNGRQTRLRANETAS
jgi:hypothetical protein